MAKCLVLGANGFIGSHLVDSMVEAGHHVRAFDRFKTANFNFHEHPNIEIFSGDFLNRTDMVQALKGIEYAFHFISTTTPVTSENNPLIDIETNIRMSIGFFQECAEAGVKRIVFASTGGAIYGDNSSEQVSESVLPLPVSPYAIGKLTIEHYLRYFEKKFGLQTLVFRISNPYGERQSLASKQGVIPIFLQHIANNESITVLGDGSMVRDYIYIKDVSHMITKSFETAKSNLYNLGSGHGLTINELVEVMRRITNKPIEIKYAEKPITYVEKIVLDIGLYAQEFQHVSKTSIDDGISAIWQYVQQKIENDRLNMIPPS